MVLSLCLHAFSYQIKGGIGCLCKRQKLENNCGKAARCSCAGARMENCCRCRVCKTFGPDSCRWPGRTQPGKICLFLVMRSLPAWQPALTAVAAGAESAKILALLLQASVTAPSCTASEGCIGLQKNFVFILEEAGKACRILRLVYWRSVRWVQICCTQMPKLSASTQSTFQTSLKIRTTGQLTSINKLLA